jgi:parallel beta-helix repeat protein
MRYAAVSLFVCIAAVFAVPAGASAQTSEWTTCASEGGYCAFSGTQEVRYGANGYYVYKTLSGGTACTNSVFGDPILGTGKTCALRASTSTSTSTAGTWTFCAVEGGYCPLATVDGDPVAYSGTREMRYGANGSYIYKTVTGGPIPCSNSYFGDPAPGAAKVCELKATTTTTVQSSWAVCANEGGFCAFSGTQQVRYGANGLYAYKTLSGGTTCTNGVFGDPAPGTPKQCAITGSTTTTAAPTTTSSSTSTSSYGPRSSITCPSGSVSIWPGTSIPFTVNQHPAGTTYCLRAGVHWITGAITPKRGDTFVGEYGAVLDGSNWSTSDSTQGAFRSHNQDIDYVTIRNLVIRKMPQKGIHAFKDFADNWTIEYNEIASNKTGILFPSYSIIRNNNIHHNVTSTPWANDPAQRGGGYMGYYVRNVTFDSNEIAYNGPEQKVMESVNVVFRNNFAHHNLADAIWYDGGNPGTLVEGNRVEDNGRNGVFYEGSSGSIIRSNGIRRNGNTGVFVSMSQNTQIYSNTLESNFRGITYHLNCGLLATRRFISLVGLVIDLKDNSARDNTIRVGTATGALANGFGFTPDCSSSLIGTYLSGSKNLVFGHNAYYVPSTTSQYWVLTGPKYWNEWQSAGHDLDGSVSR